MAEATATAKSAERDLDVRPVCPRGLKQKIAEYFRASPQPAELPMPGADYNVAPTTFQPIVRQSGELANVKSS